MFANHSIPDVPGKPGAAAGEPLQYVTNIFAKLDPPERTIGASWPYSISWAAISLLIARAPAMIPGLLPLAGHISIVNRIGNCSTAPRPSPSV